MNILYILQQSVYNKEGKWTTADSNVEMMKSILKLLVEYTDWVFHVLIGKIEDFCDIDDYREIIDSPQVKFYPQSFPVDAFLNRQNFNIYEFDDLIQNKLPKIDIIWNNITEISRNIKTYLYYRKYDAKLISCCYWLDCPMIGEEKVPIDVSYMWRQFDGFECSDLVVFTCNSTKQAFIENNKQVFSEHFLHRVLDKSTIWDFGYSSTRLDKYFSDVKIKPPIILFLNRMSGINYTKHVEFIEALKLLKKKRNDFQVVFTNPSGKISWKWLRNNVPNLLFISDKVLNRKQYSELLWKSSISVHLYELERYGGVAHREAIYTNNLVITPMCHEYLRIQGIDYPFYVDVNPNSICNSLCLALDNLDFVNTPYFLKVKKRNEESCFEKVCCRVIDDINELIKKES